MKRLRKSAALAVTLFAYSSLIGCTTIAERHVGPLTIRYDTTPGSGRVESIEIDYRNTSSDVLNDVWIETHKGERLRIADVTPVMLRARGATEWKSREAHVAAESWDNSLSLRGLSFQYKEGKLWQFSMNPEGYELGKQETAPRIGLTSKGASITLPCSEREFESLFGEIEGGKPNQAVKAVTPFPMTPK